MGEPKLVKDSNHYIRKVPIYGFTEAQRADAVNIYKVQLSNQGWLFLNLEKEGFLQYFAIFAKENKPTFIEEVQWFKTVNKFLTALISITFVAVLLLGIFSPKIGLPLLGTTIFGSIFLITKRDVFKNIFYLFGIVAIFIFFSMVNEHQIKIESSKKIAKAELELSDQKRFEEATFVAAKLLPELRSQGIGSDLVIDIKVDSIGLLYIVITNNWLALPEYEQKQLKQLIHQMTKQIKPPNGFDHSFVDAIGNTY